MREMSSSYGTAVHIQFFGQSHSAAVGATIDGLPVGERIDPEGLRVFMARRSSGTAAWSTSRHEADAVEVLSGLNGGGETCGAPMCLVVRNGDCRPADYESVARFPRPGHADLPAGARYGGRGDCSGGGHFSGRMTAALCAAGGICRQVLANHGIEVAAHVLSVADVQDVPFGDVREVPAQMRALGEGGFPTIDRTAADRMLVAMGETAACGDSLGGMVECAATGLPMGVGGPMFGGLESRIAQAVFGIPAVKGVEFGAGFGLAGMRGSAANDQYAYDIAEGRPVTRTNNCGGILGGMATGMPLVFRCAFKPVPTVGIPQATIDMEALGEARDACGLPERGDVECRRAFGGRHDACFVPRAVPVVEAACAMALLDALVCDGALTQTDVRL